MGADNNVAQYTVALKAGKRYFAEKTAAGLGGYLPVLDELIENVSIEGEIYIGLREVPIKRIIGTYSAGRSTAFAGNFMPLLAADTEFAQKWQHLYQAHLEEGIRDAIKVYEYLGYYYVMEGNKRVSVLNFVNAYSIHADVTRVIPARSNDKDIAIYYEFLDFDRRRIFDNMWFSQQGRFTWLVRKARAFAKTRPELIPDQKLDWMFDCYESFSRRYHELGFGNEFAHTTADAFAEYVRVFSFPYGLSPAELQQKVRQARPQFKLLDAGIAQRADYIDYGDEDVETERRIIAQLGSLNRRRNPSVAVALTGSPTLCGWNKAHAFAYRALKKEFEGKLSFVDCRSVPDGEEAYRALTELCADKPGLLFAAGPCIKPQALRVALESPETSVLCCSPHFERDSLPTYYCRLYEATFLCGILAGVMTTTGIVGIAVPKLGRTILACDINAFAAGAQLIRPRIRIALTYLTDQADAAAAGAARARLAQNGADIALIHCPDGGPALNRLPDDTAATLCQLTPGSGFIKEYLAMISLNWHIFYRHMAFELVAAAPALSIAAARPLHYRWGLDSGLVDVLTSDIVLGSQPVRLFRLFKQMLISGTLRPFDGTMADRDGAVRIKDGKYPSFMGIVGMDWLADVVDELDAQEE